MSTIGIRTNKQGLADELAPWFRDSTHEYDFPAIYEDYAAEVEDRLRLVPGFESLSWGLDSGAVLYVEDSAGYEVEDRVREMFRELTSEPASQGGVGVDIEPIAERHRKK